MFVRAAPKGPSAVLMTFGEAERHKAGSESLSCLASTAIGCAGRSAFQAAAILIHTAGTGLHLRSWPRTESTTLLEYNQ